MSMEDRLSMRRYLHILRDVNTDTNTFRWASDNLARLLCAVTMAKLPHQSETVTTPVGEFTGPRFENDLMVVPIYRAGQSLVQAFFEAAPGAVIGSLLIQRDEETAQPVLFYKKFPARLPKRVVIVDPMLATAGTACMAVEILKEDGYDPENIYFMGVIAAQEGLDRLAKLIPAEHITLAAIDPDLNDLKYIVPGLGDYGDRYFGT